VSTFATPPDQTLGGAALARDRAHELLGQVIGGSRD
jgi:hypothetical protein